MSGSVELILMYVIALYEKTLDDVSINRVPISVILIVEGAFTLSMRACLVCAGHTSRFAQIPRQALSMATGRY